MRLGIFRRFSIHDESEIAMRRWRSCQPNEGLTWGISITADSFIELAQKRMIFSSNRSILELGPGYGRILSSILRMNIPFKSYTGVDISRNNIKYLRDHFEQKDIDFVEGSFSEVKLDSKYDIVLSSLTLKHQYPTFHNSLKHIDQYINNNGIYFFDLLENRNIYDGKEDLTKGPSLVSWEKDGTYIAYYTQKEVLWIFDKIPLKIIAFDHVTHVKEHGDRLVVIAAKAVKK